MGAKKKGGKKGKGKKGKKEEVKQEETGTYIEVTAVPVCGSNTTIAYVPPSAILRVFVTASD